MNLYEMLPTNILISFYEEVLKNIEKEILSKNMYYELALIMLAAEQRGIKLVKPCEFDQIVDQETLSHFIQFSYKNSESEGSLDFI